MKRFLHHLFLPHEGNNHRAKALHHSSLLILVAFFVGASFLFSFTAKHNDAVLGISYSITSEELLVYTNAKRQEHGLQPLVMDGNLTSAASRKASHMFANNYWSHIAPDGTTPWYFIRDSGYEYIFAGENLARGFTTAKDVVDAWMASPTHRENMLSPNYEEIGFAIMDGTLTGDETVLVVEEFGSRSRQVAQAQQQVDEPLIPSPTPLITTTPAQQFNIQQLTPTPLPTVGPEITITPTPLPQRNNESQFAVAALRNDPLINKPAAQKNIAFVIVAGILFILALDIIIVERKGIIRMLSHNIDHIIFFGMILILIILITQGGIL